MPNARRPAGLRRRDILKGCAAAGIGALTGGAGYGFMYERHHVEITRATLEVSGWSDGLAGLRVGFLTDLHRSRTVSHGLITHAVQLLMAERPDLIVLGGDYVTWGDREFVQAAAEALAGLAAPWGVFAILGNHDDDHDMPAALAARGFTVLRDARTQIRVRAEPVDLIGIRYWTRRVEEISRLMRGASPNAILLAHTPARLLEAASLAVPARHQRSHPRWTNRPARPGGARRAQVPGHRRRGQAGEHSNIRKSRCGNSLHSSSPQLPTRSGGHHTPTGQQGLNRVHLTGTLQSRKF